MPSWPLESPPSPPGPESDNSRQIEFFAESQTGMASLAMLEAPVALDVAIEEFVSIGFVGVRGRDPSNSYEATRVIIPGPLDTHTLSSLDVVSRLIRTVGVLFARSRTIYRPFRRSPNTATSLLSSPGFWFCDVAVPSNEGHQCQCQQQRSHRLASEKKQERISRHAV